MAEIARIASIAVVCLGASWASSASAQEPPAQPLPAQPPAAQPAPAQPPPAQPPPPAGDPAAQPPIDPNAPPPTTAPPDLPPPPAQPPNDPNAPLPPGADAPQGGQPQTPPETTRGEGLRLGVDFGYTRAASADPGRFSEGSPSLLPLGIDVAARTSPTFLVGGHVYAALASRNDCLSADSCRARAYGFGPHIEVAFSKNPKASFIGWFRYGMTFEIAYQGGRVNDPTGYVYRQAIDFMDARLGGDFIVSRGNAGKTTRIGGYIGMTTGVMTGQSGVSHTALGSSGQPLNLSRDSGDPHIWFSVGMRATFDP